jgi:hypothetical protein
MVRGFALTMSGHITGKLAVLPGTELRRFMIMANDRALIY